MNTSDIEFTAHSNGVRLLFMTALHVPTGITAESTKKIYSQAREECIEIIKKELNSIPDDVVHNMNVYLVTAGDGDDGSEWQVISIHRSMKGAMKAKDKYEELRTNKDGSTYTLDANEIEVWEVSE